MKQKNTLKKFINFRFTDLTAVCEYLEDMAAQGWQLVSMRSIAVFRKCEPRQVRYAAELLGSASTISHVISDESQAYIDMCEQAGWTFVCNTGKMYIFCTESETAPDIVTDSAEKLADIKKATLKTNAITWFFLPIIMLFNVFMLVRSTPSMALMATSYMNLISMLFYALFFLTVILQTVGFTIWYLKAKRSVADNQTIPYVNLKQLKRRKLETYMLLSLLGFILAAASIMGWLQGDWTVSIFSLLVILMAAAIVGISHLLNKQQLSASGVIIISVVTGIALMSVMTFIIISVVMSVDRESRQSIQTGPAYNQSGDLVLGDQNMPVSLADLGVDVDVITNADGDNNETFYMDVYGNSTMFASSFKYRSFIDPADGDRVTLSYDIYYSSIDLLKQSFIDQWSKDYLITDDIPAEINAYVDDWEAHAVYQLAEVDAPDPAEHKSDFMVVYDDYVVVLYTHDIDISSDDDARLFGRIAEAFDQVFAHQ